MLLEAAYQAVADSSAIFWHYEIDGLQLGGLWTEKRSGHGEDAEPSLSCHLPTQHGIMAVYDGLGGAGARKVGALQDGRPRSHAFMASRLAKLAVENWFKGHIESEAKGTLAGELELTLRSAGFKAGNFPGGSIYRDLPTTIASMEFDISADRNVDLVLRWAGDSRCYLLTPQYGLQQLSRDDIEAPSQFQTSDSDHVLTNFVSASHPYRINERRWTADKPCLFICATDGVFSYFDSPAIFEYSLIDSMEKSENLRDWLADLASEWDSFANDDASLVLVGAGFASFDRLKNQFQDRWDFLRVEHWLPMHAANGQHDRNLARQASWSRYKASYLKYIRSPEE